jgi:hypothetical protein
MSASSHQPLIPIYTSRGDVEAFLVYPYLYNRNGDWIGWVTPKRQVFSVLGYYVGYMSNDPRILRKRATSTLKPRQSPPPPPPNRIPLPATVPLAPMMSELTHSVIDILMEEPERLHTVDRGELREDVD